MRALIVLSVLAFARVVSACTLDGEPPLAVLLRRATAAAAVEPERIPSMMRRARVAAILPKVQALVGKGAYDYIRNADSLTPTLVSSDTWRVELTATWSLDQLVFNAHEPRLVEASGRVAERRAQLLDRIVELWSQRRALDGHAEPDRCEALTAVLDLLTGGALGERAKVAPHTAISLPEGRPATR